MNLSNSNKLINCEIKSWDEIREKLKGKWFVCVRNKNIKMEMLILCAFKA